MIDFIILKKMLIVIAGVEAVEVDSLKWTEYAMSIGCLLEIGWIRGSGARGATTAFVRSPASSPKNFTIATSSTTPPFTSTRRTYPCFVEFEADSGACIHRDGGASFGWNAAKPG